MIAKRIFDLFFAVPGLICLSPFFVIASVWIKLDSEGPVFFRQERVGRFGRPFRIYKFRTMCSDAEAKGRQLTVGNDPRITRSGVWLRHYKLDELPQLINVILGNMSLVGPRPEVPRYVEEYPSAIREIVLSIPPGITDFASIEFKEESAILAGADDPERVYIEKILPIKLRYYQDYVKSQSIWLDFKLIITTLRKI